MQSTLKNERHFARFIKISPKNGRFLDMRRKSFEHLLKGYLHTLCRVLNSFHKTDFDISNF